MLNLKELSNQTITVLSDWNALDSVTNDVLYYRLDAVNRLERMENEWINATVKLDQSFKTLKQNSLLHFLPQDISYEIEQAWYVWLFTKKKLEEGQTIYSDIIHGERAEEILFEMDRQIFYEKLLNLINTSDSREERNVFRSFLAQIYVMNITGGNFSQLLESISRKIPGKIDSYIFIMVIIIGCSMIMVILVSLVSARKLIEPINRLASEVRNMSEREYPRRLDTVLIPDSEDEVGIIHNAFNRMAMRIHALYEESLNKERETRKAQFKALQYQINPHFLYNTLGTLQMTAAVRGDREMSETIQALSRLLRNTISKSDRLITVQEELDIMDDYIALMQIRYKHRLQYSTKLNDQAGEYFIPALVLQPLLENAVLHGLTARLNSENSNAMLSVEGNTVNGGLVLSVRDNGSGISTAQQARLLSVPRDQPETGGVCIGLKNIHDRVVLLFGNEFGIRIDSVEGEYTLIDVHLPLLMEEKDAAAFNR
jgi:sensor histidine kinase YesM